MAGLLSWLNNERKTVQHDIANGAAAAAHGLNPFDGGQGFTTQKPVQVPQPAPQPQQNNGWSVGRVLHDVTHNPVTNLPQTINNDVFKPVQRDVVRPIANLPQTFGNDVLQPLQRDVVKPAVNVAQGLASPFEYLAKADIINPTRQLAAQFSHNDVAAQNAQQATNQNLGLGPSGTNFTGGLRTFAGKAAQVGLDVLAPGIGGAIDKSFTAVVPKVVPGLLTRTVANAGTGAVLGAPLNAAAVVANPKIPMTRQNLEHSALQGAQMGAVLGGAGTVAAAAVPKVIQGLRNIPRAQRLISVKGAAASKPLTRISVTKLTPTDISGYGELDPSRVQKYRQQIRQTGKIDPILAMRGNGSKLFVEDGKHRLAAAKAEGLKSIPAKIVTPEEVHRLAQGGYVSLPGRRGAASDNEPTGKATPSLPTDSGEMLSSTSNHQVSSKNSVAPEVQPSRHMRQFEYNDEPITEGEKKALAELEGNQVNIDYTAASNELRQLANESGQPELYEKVMQQVSAQKMSQKDATAYIQAGLKQMRDTGTNVKIRLGVKNESAPPTQTARGFIVKETKPLPDGSKIVVRASKNPVTGKLETHQERVNKATDLAPSELSRTQSPSIEGQAPASRLTAEELSSLGKTPDAVQLQPKTRTGTVQPQQLSGRTSQLQPSIAREITDALEHNTYPVNRKVGFHDYLRTPERVLQKIGLGTEAKALRAADHAYKQELPKQIDQITKWRKMVGDSPGASKRIFQSLDGQKVKLNPAESKVAGQMRTVLQNWADRLGIPEEHRITNYITHIFDESIQGREFDPELEKLISDKVAGSVYDPYTLQRLGKKGYVEDAFKAMEAYTKRAVRKANFDPALEKLSNAAEGLDKSGYDYVRHYTDRINMRPTVVDRLLDNTIKQSPIGYKLGSRPTARLSRNIRQATFRASLGGNLGSAVRNLTQGVNTFAELGARKTADGYAQALKAIATHDPELERVGVMDNSFVEDRTLSSAEKLLQKADKGLFAFFQAAERINRGAAYYGAKDAALKAGKSLDEAVQAGIDTARKTQFTFGRVDTPVVLQDDLTKLLTQFQSYNVKQAEFLGDMIKDKEFAKLLRFTGASLAVFFTVGKALGYRPQDMLPSAQVGGTAPFQVPGTIGKAITTSITAKGNSNSSRGKQIEKAWMNAGSKIGSATIPGFVQGKKTVTGIRAVNAGQVKKGSSVTLLDKNKANYVKGALFGPYSLNGLPASNRVTFDGVKTTLSNDQKNKLDAMVKGTERTLDQQLQNTSAYKQLTPDQQRSKLTTLNKQITTAEKRQFAADNNLGQYAQNYKGKQHASTKTEQAILTGTYKPTVTKSSGSSGISVAPNLNKQYKATLTKYPSVAARTKAFNTQKDAEYQYDLAKYNNDIAKGTLTTAEKIRTQKTLQKENIGSVYPKNVRDLYSLSKTELSNYLATPEKGVDKAKIAKQLIAYDQALYNAGLETYLKFKTGIVPSKGGSRGRSSKTSATSKDYLAKLKFDAAKQAPKVATFSGLPKAPAKYTAPALRKYTPKSVPSKGNFTYSIHKGLV